MNLTVRSESLFKILRDASHRGELPQGKPEHLIEAAIMAGILTTEESEIVREAAIARNAAIQVDSFEMMEASQATSLNWNSEQSLSSKDTLFKF
jgi:acyl-CoA dehydrogenase